jgi:hypothetical protein
LAEKKEGKDMTTIHKLDNTTLLQELDQAVADERLKTQQVLEYLQEVERRQLFAKLGYESMFVFCTKHLKYSEGSAQRRLYAMQLMREIPEIKTSIKSGDATITNLAKLKSFIQQQERKTGTKLNTSDKSALVPLILNKTQQEVDLTFAKLSPEPIPARPTLRPISESHYELKLSLTAEQKSQLDRVRAIYSNTDPRANLNEIFTYLCGYYLKRRDPLYRHSGGKDFVTAPVYLNTKDQ